VHKIEKNNFNFFKFYVITHYVDFIKKYETANKYDTFHDETRHKYIVKKFYCKINKREIFHTQLIEHNKKRIKILTLKNKMQSTKKNSQTKKIEFTHTRVSKNSLNLKFVNSAINQHQHKNSSRSSIHWCSIRELDIKTQISNLMSIAIVFVREERLKKSEKSSNSRICFRRESNLTEL
jgi:hypothetical protein